MKIILSNQEANLLDYITMRLKIPYKIIDNMAIYDSEKDDFLPLQIALEYIGDALVDDDDDDLVSEKDKCKFEALQEAINGIPIEGFTKEETEEFRRDVDGNTIKYHDMEQFLNDKGIGTLQPYVASTVSAMLPIEIEDDEFDDICDSVINKYLCDVNKQDRIVDLTLEELGRRNLTK